MFTFFLQLADSLAHARVHYFVIFFLFVWALWLLKLIVSRFYRPYATPFLGSASVVIPVVDEHPTLFGQVLERIATQQPHEVLVVINDVDKLDKGTVVFPKRMSLLTVPSARLLSP